MLPIDFPLAISPMGFTPATPYYGGGCPHYRSNTMPKKRPVVLMQGVRCKARTKSGKRCAVRAHLNVESGLCLYHDPERRGVAHAQRVKGGKAAARATWERRAVPP